jgi:hypothetical protein
VIDRHFYIVSREYINSAFTKSVCAVQTMKAVPTSGSGRRPRLRPRRDENKTSPNLLTWSARMERKHGREFLDDRFICAMTMDVEGQYVVMANIFHRSRAKFAILRWPLGICGVREFKLYDVPKNAHRERLGGSPPVRPPVMAYLRVFWNGEVELSMRKEYFLQIMEYREQRYGTKLRIPL